jgi:hypothetical protein
MNTASPLDNQEKSVAASAASRTAVLKMFSEDPRKIPARKTAVSDPVRAGFVNEGDSDAALAFPDGRTVEARPAADAFRNILLSMAVIPFSNEKI